MATDNDPRLHAQVLCSDCRNPLVTSASKLATGHFGVEILVDKCAVCKPEKCTEIVELVINDQERVNVDVNYLQ